jgi:kinesin family member 5
MLMCADGQTGSGKSHTMFGPKGDPSQAGIIQRAALYLFKGINDSEEIEEVTIKCSFLEIYRENLRDLLNPKTGASLRVRETPAGELLVPGLVEEYCASDEDILKLIELGEKSRSVAQTDMNAVSSRSHSVFIIVVTQKLKDGSTRIGKLNLADLAGSERIGTHHPPPHPAVSCLSVRC